MIYTLRVRTTHNAQEKRELSISNGDEEVENNRNLSNETDKNDSSTAEIRPYVFINVYRKKRTFKKLSSPFFLMAHEFYWRIYASRGGGGMRAE